jgi:hypothetical protein
VACRLHARFSVLWVGAFPIPPRSQLYAPPRFHLGAAPASITWSQRGWFEGGGVSTSRVSPPGPLSTPYGHVGCLKARAFPPPA